MKRQMLLDAGPLVALLNRKDAYHRWAAAQWGQLEPPLLTCEAVVTEACYLLRHSPAGAEAMMDLLDRQIVRVAFRLEEHLQPIARLLAKYADVPMSLADACLVRMAEIHVGSKVVTLNTDFRLYRKHNRQVVPLIIPEM